MKGILLGVSLIGQSAAFAQSGADALLKSMNSSVSVQKLEGDQTAAALASRVDEIKLTNPVARQLFADWTKQSGLSYEVNAWVKRFLANDFEGFAHLKTAMDSQIPSTMKDSANAAFIYSLYKIDLAQSFFNQWMELLAQDSFSNSKASASLEEGIDQNFDQWYLDHAIQMSPTQAVTVKKIGFSRSPALLTLNAVALQRKGTAAAEVLSKLPVNSAFQPLLAKTVALGLARTGDLTGAAKVFKNYYEPWMTYKKDPQAASQYYLQIARFLYQVGSVDGAIQYYEKIPNGSKDYITAREELAWCWLREGSMDKLRGNLKTLTSSALADQFRPESYLVSSISNLKLCYYGEVEASFKSFMDVHLGWAKKIEDAIQSPDSAEPRVRDEFSRIAVQSVAMREAEIQKLGELANRSVSVALPAVGPQRHWTLASNQAKLDLESAKKTRSEEFRRQWKSDKAILVETIRKMQFVKVELLSQVGQLKQLTQNNQKTSFSAEEKRKISNAADQSFPFDGVIWNDELFKLRSLTKGSCVGQM